MKKLFVFIAVLLWTTVFSQSQEMEQLKLNLEKLAQLKLMLSQAKQGYQTLANGYNAVRDAAKGNFNLHKGYLDDLLQVSVKVRNTPGLKRLLDQPVMMTREFQGWFGQLSAMGLFKAQELSAMQARFSQITDVVHDQLDQLQGVLTPGALRMNDGERIAVINALVVQSDTQLVLLQKLINEQTLIAVQRAQDKQDRQAVIRLYGLH
ncbi:hypothetical protein [Sediminibacterium ginsengisoli]|uniref:Conjugal transfer protein TraI n=1 Tax=Sediminibacterium ginsengisoli TaxID=413434 RepID=A0A1T4NXI5_9BACT|nr:hypothetical protein [Sediminibacterium ginsengisoli]SJZ83737.1 hypothetical protein SAMN04488132_10532 [Sediminibacterium ginsengisoli]